MTTYIFLDNYRGFTKAVIPLKQVNWLVGENSTGKTSFLAVLDILHFPPFWLFEPSFNTQDSETKHFLDLVSAASKNKDTFTIGAIEHDAEKDPETRGLLVTYANRGGRATLCRISIVAGQALRTICAHDLEAEYSDYRSRRQVLAKLPTGEPISDPVELIQAYSRVHHSNARMKTKTVPEGKEGMPLYLLHGDELFEGESKARVNIPSAFSRSIVELAPIRSRPKRTYDAPQTEFSPEGEHTPYVIRLHLNRKSNNGLDAFLKKTGESSGLFRSVQIKQYGKQDHDPFELQVALGNTALRVENVGYGVSQALPVLVEMFVRPTSSVFCIQQPEVHLHPRAQASFGDAVADLGRDEKKIFFIETHSDFSIDRFRLNCKRNGPIPSQLLFFQRSGDGNEVVPIEILKDGALPDDQPPEYREFFYNESLEML